MNIVSQIEALLFVSGRPMAIKRISKIVGASDVETKNAILELSKQLKTNKSGIELLQSNNEVQLVTSPEYTELLKEIVKEELSGELTRPSLEALAIIAYRGPVLKTEIEQIRGINCSLILRNLLLRELIEENTDENTVFPTYSVSSKFLRHLGVSSVREFPEYINLHNSKAIDTMLNELEKSSKPMHGSEELSV
ncbi:MAG: Segregation and condensation protein B [uncultured bacterium]|nr:MAG: Segregation and condensation protein B [uncultured bacterium]HBD04917.1 SMC-Scp complex subunit ScpB [Candidatus Uhrbacteria bacterium]